MLEKPPKIAFGGGGNDPPDSEGGSGGGDGNGDDNRNISEDEKQALKGMFAKETLALAYPDQEAAWAENPITYLSKINLVRSLMH